MSQNRQPCNQIAKVPSSVRASSISGDEFFRLVRARERYQWLLAKVEPWIGLYSVPELEAMVRGRPTLPGQRQKALVALSITPDLSALAALQSFDPEEYDEPFRLLYEVALGQCRMRAHRDS